MQTGWKFLRLLNGKIVSYYDNSEWTIGKWRKVAAPIRECMGLNCSKTMENAYSFVHGDVVAKVEYKGIVIEGDDKLTCQYMRIKRAWRFTNQALQACMEAQAKEWKAYTEARSTALKVYEEAKAPALKVYWNATASERKAYVKKNISRETYEAATDTAWRAYDEAKAPALKAYNEAMNRALKAYEEARRVAWESILHTLERIR